MTSDNVGHEMNDFQAFFEYWLSEQGQHLEDLIIASEQHQKESADNNGQGSLSSLVDKVMKHYEQYYNAKFQWANHDVLQMMTPPWRSSLEDALLWIGGWRPSMAFHLLYSKSGLQLEARFAELMRGLRLSTGDDLGDLSHCQHTMVDKLQRRTIQEETNLWEKMAKLEETVADAALVELAHEATEMMRRNEGDQGGGNDHNERVEPTLASKEEDLVKILHKADDLRMRTLKNIMQILSPMQGVHFLIATAELHLRVHDWGKKKDALRN